MNIYEFLFIFYGGFILVCLIIALIFYISTYKRNKEMENTLRNINETLSKHHEVIKKIEKIEDANRR